MGYIAFAIGFVIFFLLLAVLSSAFAIPASAMLPIGGILLLIAILAIVLYGYMSI